MAQVLLAQASEQGDSAFTRMSLMNGALLQVGQCLAHSDWPAKAIPASTIFFELRASLMQSKQEWEGTSQAASDQAGIIAISQERTLHWTSQKPEVLLKQTTMVMSELDHFLARQGEY